MSVFGLADELFLIGHHEHSGKPVVNDEVLEIGLAGAALGELLLQRRLSIVEGAIAVVDRRPWAEPVSDAILAEVQHKGEAFVARAWIDHLRGEIREALARRLVEAGLVRRVETRSGLTRRMHVRYCRLDPMVCTRPLVGATYQLARPHLLDAQTAALAGLMLATGLDHLITLDKSQQEIRDLIIAAVHRLPHQIRTLLTDVDAAVTALAVTVRR